MVDKEGKMKQIIIVTQQQLDELKKIEKDEEVIIEKDLKLNCIVEVWGKLIINAKIDCSWFEDRYFVARGNSAPSIEAWGNSAIRSFSANLKTKIKLFGFSVCWIPLDLKINIQKKSKYAVIQKVKPLDWFERNAIEKKDKVILYKRVSKDFKTQERTSNETLWKIGSIVEHKNWQPEKDECGDGKFHAVSRPYFADEFRSQIGDKYIAVEIAKKDLYEWKNNPQYPHKIGFRKGKVLYECDKFSKNLTPQEK